MSVDVSILACIFGRCGLRLLDILFSQSPIPAETGRCPRSFSRGIFGTLCGSVWCELSDVFLWCDIVGKREQSSCKRLFCEVVWLAFRGETQDGIGRLIMASTGSCQEGNGGADSATGGVNRFSISVCTCFVLEDIEIPYIEIPCAFARAGAIGLVSLRGVGNRSLFCV